MESTPRRELLRQIMIVALIWVLVGLALSSLSYISTLRESSQVHRRALFTANLFFVYGLALLFPLVYLFTRRFRIDRRRFLLRLLTHIPVAFVLLFLQMLLYVGAMWVTRHSFVREFTSLMQAYRTYFLGTFYFGFLLYALTVISIHAYLNFREFRDEQARAGELQMQLSEASLQALKMQLQPHFLFNTLHSISALVFEDPEKASTMIARLGDFLRLTLDRSADQTVPLKEELEFLRCYLEIEQIRFSDRLTVTIDAPAEVLAAQVPHLILQPIVENAIRHGIAPVSRPGRIDISAARVGADLSLSVRDNGPGLSGHHHGVGLRNVRERLDRMYGNDSQLEVENIDSSGVVVNLTIPFMVESD